MGVINKVLSKPLQLTVRNVCGGGEQDWACVELLADSVAKNGMDYQQRYSWVMRFDESGTIVEASRPSGLPLGIQSLAVLTQAVGACISGLCSCAESGRCEFLIRVTGGDSRVGSYNVAQLILHSAEPTEPTR